MSSSALPDMYIIHTRAWRLLCLKVNVFTVFAVCCQLWYALPFSQHFKYNSMHTNKDITSWVPTIIWKWSIHYTLLLAAFNFLHMYSRRTLQSVLKFTLSPEIAHKRNEPYLQLRDNYKNDANSGGTLYGEPLETITFRVISCKKKSRRELWWDLLYSSSVREHIFALKSRPLTFQGVQKYVSYKGI